MSGQAAANSHPVATLLESTIDALSVWDTERLEQLVEEAEALRSRCAAISERPLELRAMRQTLHDLLRSTEGNLRVLNGLRGLRSRGLDQDRGGYEEFRWLR